MSWKDYYTAVTGQSAPSGQTSVSSATSSRVSQLGGDFSEEQKQAVEKVYDVLGWKGDSPASNSTNNVSTPTTTDVTRGRGGNDHARQEWVYRHGTRTATQEQVDAIKSSQEVPKSANQTVSDLQQRRKELESEKKQNARYSLVDGILTNTNTDYDAEIADIDKQIAEAKNQDDYRTWWDKTVDTISGAFTGSVASKTDAMRALYEGGQNSRTAEYEREIEQLQKDYDRAKRDYEETLELEGEEAAQWAKNTLDDAERKLNAYKKVVDENVQQKATQATAEMADDLQQQSAEKIERAKDGNSALGNFAVDAGVAAAQMGIDALTGAALGIGSVGSKGSMALRAFGGGTQEARQGGGAINEQLGYGAGVAATEVLSEMLSGGGLDMIYGKGFADDLIEKAIGKMAKTNAGRTALRVIQNGASEGIEEIFSDAVNPLLRSIYNDKSVAENYSEEELSDWLYDGLVGAALGIAGSGVSIATGADAKKNAELRSGNVDNVIELMTGKKATSEAQNVAETAPTDTAPTVQPQNATNGIDNVIELLTGEKAATEPQSNVEAQGDITTPPTPSNDAVARPVELNSAVNNNVEAQNADVQKNTAPTGTESTAANDNPATHTAEEMARIEDYKASTDESLKEVVEEYYADPKKPFSRHNISSVTEKQAADIATVLGGGNYNGFKNAINSDGIKHILNEHGPNGSVNHSMGDLNDIARIGYVLDNYDDVRLATYPSGDQRFSEGFQNSDNSPAPMVVFTKKVNGTYYVVEAVPDTKYKKLWVVSAYLDKKGGVTQASDATSPEVTSKTSLASPPQSENIFSDNSIPTAEENVNREQAENSGSSEQRAKSNLGSKSTRAKTSQAVETLMEADITPDERVEQLNPYVEKGRFDYIPDTNEAQVDRATKKIAKDGWEQSVKDFHDDVIKGKSGKDLMAEGAVLLNNAANSDASAKAYLELANDYIELAHRAGEALQAAKIVQQLTPEGRLYMLSKNVNSINKNLTKGQREKIAKKKEGKGAKNLSPEDIANNYDVTIDEGLAQEYLNAETEEQRDAALEKIQQNIADQIPTTALEKWNALRYVNMLGNFKTQIRNVGGNVLMMATQKAKNRVKAAAEATANLFLSEENKIERTSVLHVDRDLKKEAAADFDTVKDIARGEGKYSDTAKMSRDIQDKRRIFDSKIMEFYRKATNWAMDAGDVIFLKENYADALGGWLQAHGIKSMADATDEQLDRARAYAIQEAQEATFRDTNVVSKAVTQIGRNPITEGVIPFRKTPANVAVRAVEYSPFGAAETVYKAVQAKKGNANANDVINSLSKNIVGTALAAAGYALAKAGFARSSEDDDDLENFQKMEGQQDYGVRIGDTWLSLSQLAPNAVPLYMGVMLYEAMDGGSLTWDNAYSLLGCLNDPLMDMSMLSGVEDTLSDVISYGDDGNMVWKTAANAVLSYLTQGINNTLVGQFEQASEENRQTVYSDDDSILPDNVQYKLGKSLGKIPGVDYHQQDYVDAWGRKQSNGSAAERIFNAFLNPFYSSKDSTTEVDAELERLYKAGKDVDGFPNVLPQKASRSTEYVKGSTMTPEEYEQYSVERGQKSYELVSDFMASDEYKNMTDVQRAEVISNLYTYAADRALKTVKTANGVEYTGKLDNVSNLTDVPEYYASKEILSDNVGEGANYDAIDSLLQNFSNLSSDTQAALKDSNDLNVNDLLYAQLFGIDSKSYYDTKAEVKTASEKLGGTNNATAIAIYNSMDGASDAEILNAIRSQLPPDSGGKQQAVVRRAEAYMTVAGNSADLGSWLNLVAELADADENGSVSKADVQAAWSNMGLNSKQTYAGITQTDFYNIVKSSKSYASNSEYATQIDENYAKINPATEKEKAQLGGTVNGHSKSDIGSSSSDSAYDATMEYFRALGLLK